jgi:ATP adenylyltransferase
MNEFAFAMRDAKPITSEHTLVIPKRHARDLFSITSAELTSVFQLIHDQSTQIQSQDITVEGFNVGTNIVNKQDKRYGTAIFI